jgi:hypothetical protein
MSIASDSNTDVKWNTYHGFVSTDYVMVGATFNRMLCGGGSDTWVELNYVCRSRCLLTRLVVNSRGVQWRREGK